MFGGFGVVWRSKRERVISCLEGLGLCGAPNAGNPSHIWRVVEGLSLQTRGDFLAFVVGLAAADHICRVVFSRLEGLAWCIAPNVRDDCLSTEMLCVCIATRCCL